MSSADRASHTLTRAARDLEQQLQHDRGPEPRELRRIVDTLYDACGQLLQVAGDIESGLVD